jgi:RsiW-degrading membrane proteinase PrsW (M82 family)
MWVIVRETASARTESARGDQLPCRVLAVILLGAAPSLFLLLFFYLKDRYEPEPRGHVALAFLKGAVALVPSYFIAYGLERLVGREWLALGGLPARLFEAAAMAGGAEEVCKWIIFFAFIYRWSEFDEPLDAVVYGVAMALGFATVENILCVHRDGITTGLLRAIFAVPAHALFGAVMGFYFGRAKLGAGQHQGRDVTPAQRRSRVWLALFIPVLFHSAYDFALIELRGVWMYAVVAFGSLTLWMFVLRRVHLAQQDSPFKNP